MKITEVANLGRTMGCFFGVAVVVTICLIVFLDNGEEESDGDGSVQADGCHDETTLLKFFHFHTIGKHHNRFKSFIMGKEDETSVSSGSDGGSRTGSENHKQAEENADEDEEQGRICATRTNTMLSCNKTSSRSNESEVIIPPPKSYCCSSVHPVDVIGKGVATGEDGENRRMHQCVSRSSTGDEDNDNTEAEEECCSICLEGYIEQEVICTPKTEGCNHVFHKECLFEWVKKNHSECPLCRTVLLVEVEERRQEQQLVEG